MSASDDVERAMGLADEAANCYFAEDSGKDWIEARAALRAEVERLVEDLDFRAALVHALLPYQERAVVAERALAEAQADAKRLRQDLWWLVGGGEFASWIETGVEMPLAAMKEWEEARRHFPELKEEQ